ncbi:sphingomyelin phosphodiesterase [Hahella sp. NBU794]|uniref:sphingomyelin phosphodiesterase n=1 Tax=Hahella sp. NBU794 TaxID=3422590 RepID=UPI003D6EC7CA
MRRLYKWLAGAAMFLLLTRWSWAETYIYLTNSTMETVTLSTAQSGYDNIREGVEWDRLETEIPPLATVKILRFNRDQGIKWGKTYFFDTTVMGRNSTALLRQKLEGTWNFSKMWIAADDDPWRYDRDIHAIPREFDGVDSHLAYRSQYARPGGDDVYYVINNDWTLSERVPQSNHLKVLTYNAWALLPGLMSKNTSNRLATMAEAVKGYDAVVFQEVFDPILTARFRSDLQAEYPYLTEIPFKLGRILTGGSFIASRWPILEQNTMVYEGCRNDGCFASKGANYAKIDKGGQIYHLFGTHTHAYTGEEDVALRRWHFQQYKAFVDSKGAAADEPVIIAGDLNVDKLNFPTEHQDMLAILDVADPPSQSQYPHTYDGGVNTFADSKYTEYLDYVLTSNAHVAPVYSHNRVRIPRFIEWEHWTTWDLSDHFPVEGEFVFPLPAYPVE